MNYVGISSVREHERLENAMAWASLDIQSWAYKIEILQNHLEV